MVLVMKNKIFVWTVNIQLYLHKNLLLKNLIFSLKNSKTYIQDVKKRV